MSIGMFEEALSELSQSSPSHDQIREELTKIIHSKSFDASERNRLFLQYVVEETLEGRAHYIKGYTVARSVFHRDPDFDPQLDPVVRIEASRLRRSLERYYLTAGKADLVVVELPKGGYVPRFELHPQTAPETAPPALSDASDESLSPTQLVLALGPSIVLSPFENLSGDPAYDLLSRGITEELIARLTRYEELIVRPAGADVRPASVAHDGGLVFALKGSVRTAVGRLRVAVRLLNNENGTYL